MWVNSGKFANASYFYFVMLRLMTRSMKFFTLASGLMLALFAGCKPDVENPDNSHYPEAVAKIVAQNCAVRACHAGPQPSAGLNLESWESLFAGARKGSVLVPFRPEWSHLFHAVNTDAALGPVAQQRMPYNGDPLPAADAIAIREWIAGGALDYKGGYAWQAARNRNSGKLFALCAGSDLVAVVDVASNLLMEYVSVGLREGFTESPHYITLSPDKQFFYVTLINSGAAGGSGSAIVEKYRTDNYSFEGRINVDSDPALLTISPDGKRALLSHFNDAGGARLSLLDTENMAVLDRLTGPSDLLHKPHGIASTSDFRYHYAAASNGNYYARIEIAGDRFADIEYFLLDPSETVPLGSTRYAPYYCILLESKKQLIISNNRSNDVRIFHTDTGQLLHKINVGAFPRLMAYDAADNRLFVACANEENAAQQGDLRGCLSVVDLNSNTEIKRIFNLGHRPHGVAIDPTRRYLFVTLENIGGAVPPHHVVDGLSGPPGQYALVDLRSLLPISSATTDIAVFPNACVVIE